MKDETRTGRNSLLVADYAVGDLFALARLLLSLARKLA